MNERIQAIEDCYVEEENPQKLAELIEEYGVDEFFVVYANAISETGDNASRLNATGFVELTRTFFSHRIRTQMARVGLVRNA